MGQAGEGQKPNPWIVALTKQVFMAERLVSVTLPDPQKPYQEDIL